MADVFYSVRPAGAGSGNDLKVACNIVIASGVATFSVAQTGDIGVGCYVLSSNTDGYISEMTDSTHAKIITALGATHANVSSEALTSIYHPYASLSAAEAGSDDANHLNTVKLVTDTKNLFWPCYGATADSAHLYLQGNWITSDTYRITIYTPQGLDTKESINSWRHAGKWDNNKHHFVASSETRPMRLYNQSYVSFIGLQSDQPGTGGYNFYINSDSDELCTGLKIDSCIIKESASSNTSSAINVYSNNSTDENIIYIDNCIIYTSDTYSSGSEGIYLVRGNVALNVRNSTICGFNDGIERDNGTVTITNCAVFNNDDDFDGTITANYCASDDVTGTNAVDISSGATESTEWAKAFTDYANGDFSVKDVDSVLYNAGTTIAAVTTDIIGTARPQSTAYDIGAFEFPVAVAAGAIINQFQKANLGADLFNGSLI